MTSAAATASVIVEALLVCGVREAVLSPGSRSAPLAFALAAAERQRRLRLHVRIDERSAGFLALGLAKAKGVPVPVVVTSGSAVANLFPAVVEASASGVPLLVLSADRPPVLRGVGASQTIDQLKLFGGYVRHFVDLAAGADYAASAVGHAIARATSPDDPGPVQLNCPFAEPLLPEGDAGAAAVAVPRPLHRASAGPPMADVMRAAGFGGTPERGLIVAGDGASTAGVDALAAACGWPVIAEPTAGMHGSRAWVPAGPLVAGSREWVEQHRPDVVLSVGRVGLTRPVVGLLRTAIHVAIDPSGADPLRTAAVTVRNMPLASEGEQADDGWSSLWREAGDLALRQVDQVLDAEPVFTGLHVARHVWRAAPHGALLFVASSWPIRQVFATQSRRDGVRVLANRGANGIDGLVSAAWGAALGHDGPSVALLGDLAFLHDGNGLLAPSLEERPPLTYVVIDNDGGGIFSQLEQGDAKYAQDFERIFGTPHGLNLLGRARLSAVPGREVQDLDRFAEAFAKRPAGVSVLVAKVGPRAYEAQLLARLQHEVSAALA